MKKKDSLDKNKIKWLSLFEAENGTYVFYKNTDDKKKAIKVLKSSDGVDFFSFNITPSFQKKFLGLMADFDIDDDFKISKVGDIFVLSYYAKTNKKKAEYISIAISDDGLHWKKLKTTSNIKKTGLVIETNNPLEKYVMFFKEQSIRVATSMDLEKWDLKRSAFLHPREKFFDHQDISLVSAAYLKEGIVVLYNAENKNDELCLGAVLLDKRDYRKILWRSARPIWKQAKDVLKEDIKFLGSFYQKGEMYVYWEMNGEFRVIPISNMWVAFENKQIARKKINNTLRFPVEKLKLEKCEKNPILEPITQNDWESRETFNPAAINLDGKVHLLYRALGERGVSVLGYASSDNGIDFEERSKKPVYAPMQPFEYGGEKKMNFSYPYSSGGSWSGCEDPRVTLIGKRIFMTYTAFNGTCPPGVALTSISVKDFLAKNWNWKIPRLISESGKIQKNWVVFPEKINGKYAILHSISPEIYIDYFDSLDDESIIIKSYHNNKSDPRRWDNILRGVAAPPLKTNYGWLVFYHAMDARDPNKYKVGAMILDYKNPQKILYRSSQPILEPIEKYENEGSKSGVVYVCGSVIKDRKIYVYYGGADRFTCVATAPLNEFLEALVGHAESAPFMKLALN